MFVLFVSDGGGRSGVYLAIDANMELAEEEDGFDVFGYLKMLRQSRKGMIESLVSLNNKPQRWTASTLCCIISLVCCCLLEIQNARYIILTLT